MNTLAHTADLDSQFGVDQELPRVGSALENPFVFDASAKELKATAAAGLIEILGEGTSFRTGELLVDRLRFRRVR